MLAINPTTMSNESVRLSMMYDAGRLSIVSDLRTIATQNEKPHAVP